MEANARSYGDEEVAMFGRKRKLDDFSAEIEAHRSAAAIPSTAAVAIFS